MPTIPTYTSKESLDTAATTIPEIKGLDKSAVAMQNLGQTVSDLGSHMLARARQTEDANAQLAYMQASIAAKESSQNAINNNEAPDGAGMTDEANAAISANTQQLLKGMSPRLQKEYAVRFDVLRREHLMVVSDAQTKKNYGYWNDQTSEHSANAAGVVKVDPTQYDAQKKELTDLINKEPVTPAQKQAMLKAMEADLQNGKIAGEVERDPNGAKRMLGEPSVENQSTSGAKISPGKFSSERQVRQLGFVWHEMTGSGGLGGSSEAGAYQRLKSANTLEGAVNAGFDYERPSIRNFDYRFARAKEVLAGTASPSAMRARAFFEKKGLSAVQASGLVGVLIGESGRDLNPGAYNPNDPGGSEGVGQWNQDRKANMRAFVQSGRGQDIGAGLSAGVQQALPDVEPQKYTGGVDPAFEGTDFKWRQQWITKADDQIKSNETATYTAAKTRTTQVGNDALATFANNGEVSGVDEPNYSDFVEANKGNTDQADRDWNNYQDKRSAAILTHSFQYMTSDEIAAAVAEKQAAIPAGPGAAEATAVAQFVTTAGVNIIKDRQAAADAAERAAKAANEAAQKALKDRQENSFNYAMGGNQAAQDAWNNVSTDPNGPATPFGPSIDQTAVAKAIDTMYHAETNLGTLNDNLQLLPPDMVKQIITNLTDPTIELSLAQKRNSLANVFNLTSNDHYRRIIFNQLQKAGLPPEMKFPLEAYLRGDEGAYIQLFAPALAASKDMKPAEGTKLTAMQDLAEAQIDSPHGQAVFGSGIVDPQAIQDQKAARNLMVNYALMKGGKPEVDIEKAAQYIFGDDDLLASTFSNGTSTQLTMPKGTDKVQMGIGFQKLIPDVNKIVIDKYPIPGDPTREPTSMQIVNQGQFRNYHDGYGFRLPDGTWLPDPKNPEQAMIWQLQDVMAASRRPDLDPKTIMEQQGRFLVPRITGSDSSGGPAYDVASAYPGLDTSGYTIIQSPDDNSGRQSEYWPPGEPGDAQYPRPKSIPLDKPGIELIGSKAQTKDIAGEIVSHDLVKSDPTIKGYYDEFKATITPAQEQIMKNAYADGQTKGETRTYAQWKEDVAIPSLMRGYTFNQYSDADMKEVGYTDKQKAILDKINVEIKTKKKKIRALGKGGVPLE